MDKASVGRIILMSIHPKYADAILRGVKRVEFRKKPIAHDVTHVVVYATKPVGKVVGSFNVVGQRTDAPKALWKQYRNVAGINEQDFLDYFGANSVGTGICIGETHAAHEPLDLETAFGISRPPQNYRYLCVEQVQDLLDLKRTYSVQLTLE